MLLALHAIDYGVLLLVLACIGLIVAFFAAGSGEAAGGFFSARKGIGWFPAALSLASAVVGSGRIAEIIGAGYDYGWKVLAAVAGLFLASLLVWWLAHPLLARVESGSLFEYLELRFDRRLRGVAAGIAVVSLAIALVSLLATAAGWIGVMECGAPAGAVVVVVALLGILLAAFGGLRGVIWSDVVLLGIVVAGGAALLLGALHQTTGGAAGAWQASIDFDRRAIVDLTWNPSEAWSIWLALPAWTIAWSAWLITRPDIQQRWTATGDASSARYSLLLEGFIGCCLLAGLIYAGLVLLAFYQQDPDRPRPIWVANIFAETGRSYSRPETRHAPLLDPRTGQPRVALSGHVQIDPTDGTPLLDFYADDLTPANLPDLVAQRRLIQPNSQEPFTSTEGLFDAKNERIQLNAILVRRGATRERKRPEIVLHHSARPQLAPYFTAQHLPWGIQGLVAAGLIGGVVCAFAAGLNAIALVLGADFYGGLGWGKSLVAAWQKKSEESLASGDELPLLRWLIGGFGIAIAAAASAVGVGDGWLSLVASVAGLAGGPLLAVFLLGLLTRQATPLAVLMALVVGLGVSAWSILGPDLARRSGASALWPFAAMSDAGGVVLGTVATLLLGAVLSFFIGEARETREIRGLVVATDQPDLHLPEKLPSGQTTVMPKIVPPRPPRDASESTEEEEVPPPIGPPPEKKWKK